MSGLTAPKPLPATSRKIGLLLSRGNNAILPDKSYPMSFPETIVYRISSKSALGFDVKMSQTNRLNLSRSEY